MDTLFVFSRPPQPDELRLLSSQAQAKVLLLGSALFSDSSLYGERSVLVLRDEVEELGLGAQLAASFSVKSGAEVIDTLLSHRLFNF